MILVAFSALEPFTAKIATAMDDFDLHAFFDLFEVSAKLAAEDGQSA